MGNNNKKNTARLIPIEIDIEAYCVNEDAVAESVRNNLKVKISPVYRNRILIRALNTKTGKVEQIKFEGKVDKSDAKIEDLQESDHDKIRDLAQLLSEHGYV